LTGNKKEKIDTCRAPYYSKNPTKDTKNYFSNCNNNIYFSSDNVFNNLFDEASAKEKEEETKESINEYDDKIQEETKNFNFIIAR